MNLRTVSPKHFREREVARLATLFQRNQINLAENYIPAELTIPLLKRLAKPEQVGRGRDKSFQDPNYGIDSIRTISKLLTGLSRHEIKSIAKEKLIKIGCGLYLSQYDSTNTALLQTPEAQKAFHKEIKATLKHLGKNTYREILSNIAEDYNQGEELRLHALHDLLKSQGRRDLLSLFLGSKTESYRSIESTCRSIIATSAHQQNNLLALDLISQALTKLITLGDIRLIVDAAKYQLELAAHNYPARAPLLFLAFQKANPKLLLEMLTTIPGLDEKLEYSRAYCLKHCKEDAFPAKLRDTDCKTLLKEAIAALPPKMQKHISQTQHHKTFNHNFKSIMAI